MKIAKISTLILGGLAIVLGILFKGQNVAFLVGLAFAIAASANFPALIMSIIWKRFTTMGAVTSIYSGLIAAIVLLILSPTVWVDIAQKDAKVRVETQIKELDTAMQTVDTQLVELHKQIIRGVDLSAIELERNKAIEAAGEAKKQEKDRLEARKKDAAAAMPKAVFPLRNPALYSMAVAFLFGIMVSLLAPEKEAEDKFSDEKVRKYIGIGAE